MVFPSPPLKTPCGLPVQFGHGSQGAGIFCANETGGGGKTTKCGACHGADLKGLGPVPGLAGRSPSYLVRQLYDMQQGVRKGIWTELMKPVVAHLSDEDMIAIAAYTASRKP